MTTLILVAIVSVLTGATLGALAMAFVHMAGDGSG